MKNPWSPTSATCMVWAMQEHYKREGLQPEKSTQHVWKSAGEEVNTQMRDHQQGGKEFMCKQSVEKNHKENRSDSLMVGKF